VKQTLSTLSKEINVHLWLFLLVFLLTVCNTVTLYNLNHWMVFVESNLKESVDSNKMTVQSLYGLQERIEALEQKYKP
jgi:hypothetical protein